MQALSSRAPGAGACRRVAGAPVACTASLVAGAPVGSAARQQAPRSSRGALGGARSPAVCGAAPSVVPRPMAGLGGSAQPARSVLAHAAPEQAPGSFPWDESEYYKVEFVGPPYGPVAIDSAGSQWRGVLLFQVAGQAEPATEDTRVMEIFISGDACISIYTHLCPSDNTRPMALDILWQMWQRGRQISKRDWSLLRVAVVACVSDVYYGRLFFGDPDSQLAQWDADVRPSDATFLALKANAPIYIKKSVWEACSTPLRNSSTWTTVNFLEGQQRAERERRAAGGGSGSSSSGSSSGERHGSSREQQHHSQLSPDSLPAIRLLMREMEVAVREEAYEEAARIRDHPWMRLAEDINMHRSIGYYDQAMRLMGELRGLIENHERAMGKEYEARLSAQHQARQHLEGVLRLQQQEAQPGQPGPGQQGQGEGSEVQQNESSKRD